MVIGVIMKLTGGSPSFGEGGGRDVQSTIEAAARRPRSSPECSGAGRRLERSGSRRPAKLRVEAVCGVGRAGSRRAYWEVGGLWRGGGGGRQFDSSAGGQRGT